MSTLTKKGNLEIVDTPGFNNAKEMEEYIMDYVKKAIAVIVVLNSANAGGLMKSSKDGIGQVLVSHYSSFSYEIQAVWSKVNVRYDIFL